MRFLPRTSLLFFLFLSYPLSAQGGPGRVSSSSAQMFQEEGRFVRQVFLDLRTMSASEAASEGDFYLSFPTLDRRHRYRYLTRRGDQGLRLRFHSGGGEDRQRFDWRLRGAPGSDSCALTQCDLPSIPIEDMEGVEIRAERPACGETDPIGIEEATISYVLNNEDTRRVRLNNLWIPCVEFPASTLPGQRIKKITVTLQRDTERSSLGKRIKGKIDLGNGVFLPLATQTPSRSILETLTYEFLGSHRAYQGWRTGRPDYYYWPRVELGCRSGYHWNVEWCAEAMSRHRSNREREEMPNFWFDQYCENYYDSSCRYPPFEATGVDPANLKIDVDIDYHGWYGWNSEEIDPVYIDQVEMQFEKENGERSTLSYNADYQLPCSRASQCTIEAEPERVYLDSDLQLSWRISGEPTSVEDTIRSYGSCFMGGRPLDPDVDLPMEGEAECRYGIPISSFWIDTRWSCPDVSPDSRRLGVSYERDTYTYRCEAALDYRDSWSLRIIDSAGCPHILHSYDEQHATNLSTATINSYIDKFGIGLNRWRNLTPDYPFYQNRNPFKRLLTAIHFLKNRRWENYNQELFEGERIRNDSFYELVGRPIDSLNPISSSSCLSPTLLGLTDIGPGDEDVTLSRFPIFEAHPLARAKLIIHEGWHAYRDGAPHYDCNGGNGNCDYSWDYNGAYRAEILFDSWIYGECANCSPLIKERARDAGNVTLDWKFYIDPGFRL